MSVITQQNCSPMRTVALAGLAGGLAEALWIALYGLFATVSGADVARQVAATLVPAAIHFALAPALGLAIHFALSLGLAFVFARLIYRPFIQRRGAFVTLEAALASLVVVWAINFLVVLPHWNPPFATLLPCPVTLLSKVLFGVAMAAVLAPWSTRPHGLMQQASVA